MKTLASVTFAAGMLYACGDGAPDAPSDGGAPDAAPQPDAGPTVRHSITVEVAACRGGGSVSAGGRTSASPGDSDDWDFGAGTEVTLTATPDAYSEFMGWDGLCDGDGPCTFVITEDVELSLRFEPRATEKYMRHLANPEGRATDVHALDADQSGAVVVAAKLLGGTDLGGHVTEDGTNDVLAVFDANGELRWAMDFTSDIEVETAGFDGEGGVLFAGQLERPTTIAGVDVDPGDQDDLLLVRLDAATAELDWLAQHGGEEYAAPELLAVDGQGGVAIVGQYSDQLTLSGLPTISSTADDTAFVARFSVADGTAIWARSLDGTGPFVDHNAVDISPAGEILIGGRFKETLDVGGGPLQNPNDQYTAAYAAAFDSTGDVIFSATLTAQNGGEVIGAYFGPTGERWVVGDAFDITPPGASEAITGGIAARLDDSGAISRLIVPGVASISHLAFDEAGKIVATAGQIAAGNELPQGSLYVEKFSDAFVAHVDPSSGKIASAQRFGCGRVDRVLGFALHEGDFLVGGVISEGLTFGGDFYATETSDAYVARFSIPGGE